METFYEYANISLIALGLVAILLELLVGLDTLLDLTVVGITMVISGLLALVIGNNIWVGLGIFTLLIVAYFILFRSQVHKSLSGKTLKSNSDKLIGEVVNVSGKLKNGNYIVKVEGENWTVESENELKIGDKVEIIRAEGSILKVKLL